MLDPIEGTHDSNPDANGTASFLDGITDEGLKGNELLAGYAAEGGLEKLAADFVALKGQQPQVPENPAGYKLEFPEGTPEQYVKNMEGFKAIAHEKGFTQEQLAAADQYMRSLAEQAQTQMKQATEDAIKANKDAMGDQYEPNLAKAAKVLKAFKGEGLLKKSLDPENPGEFLGNNPEFFNFLVGVAAAISEDKLELGGGGPTDTVKRDQGGNPQLSYPSMKKG